MKTIVRDLMTTPALTCGSGDTLADAAREMQEADTGSVVVTDGGKVAGILTERDLLRAAAAVADPGRESVRLWMTAQPDVLGPDERVDAAWASLTSHHYRHLPVVEAGACVGVVSLRDLMGVARIRPAAETSGDVPAGLEGVVVAETTVGDVRGQEGFFHYRQYSAVELAESRTLEDVWYLLFRGELPRAEASAAFAAEIRRRRVMPPGLSTLLPALAQRGAPLDVLRTAVSLLGAELGWRPTHDIEANELEDQALGLCAVVPTILAAAYRLRQGEEPLEPRHDLGAVANYLFMLTGQEPTEAHAVAIEQYMILTIDHGFNASTFTARVVTSTGADLGAAIVAAIGALSGPLHGGAPSRALDTLDAIGTRLTEPMPTCETRCCAENASWVSATACTRPTTPLGPAALGLRASRRPAGRVLPGGGADDGRRAGRAQARAAAVHQRRVLRRRRHAHLRHPARDVHPDLRLRSHHRLVHPRDGTGIAQPADPPRRPLRRAAPSPTGAGAVTAPAGRPA